MILGVTGHRPDKLPDRLTGYHPTNPCIEYVKKWTIKIIEREAPSKIITGMALGYDTIVAQICTELSIPFIAAVPFLHQDLLWNADTRANYHRLLNLASEVVTVSSGGYSAAKMQVRNAWIVNKSDKMLACWDGSPGGTYNCLQYAKICHKEIIRIDPRKYAKDTLI